MEQPKASIAEQAARLRQRLSELKWPQRYMFKFIMPNKQETVDTVMELLPTTGKISFANSRNGNYTSVTCVCVMASADDVMDITEKACKVPGVISL